MSQQTQDEQKKASWKTQVYLIGSAIGAAMGFLSAYLFAKEAEDVADKKEERPDIPSTALIGLALSVLTLVRQFAETGRKNKKGKKE